MQRCLLLVGPYTRTVPFICLDSSARCRIGPREAAQGRLEKAELGEQRQLGGQTRAGTRMGHWSGVVIVESHPVTKSISTVRADPSQPGRGSMYQPGSRELRFAPSA